MCSNGRMEEYYLSEYHGEGAILYWPDCGRLCFVPSGGGSVIELRSCMYEEFVNKKSSLKEKDE